MATAEFSKFAGHYGMGSISALHGITLSAWGFAGLTGNQMAAWIVRTFGKEDQVAGYQCVLYATLALYIISLVISVVMVKPNNNKAD